MGDETTSRVKFRMRYQGSYYTDYGNTVDYRVLDKDLRVVLSTNDKSKAERIAKKICGSVHCSSS